MAKPTPVAAQIAALNELRADPNSKAARERLLAALKDRSNRIVARAAEIAGDSANDDLASPLIESYTRLLVDPVKKDPGCVGKIAVAEALVKLECHDLEFYRGGICYTQHEPVWGGEEDMAAPIRSACAMGMVLCASILEALNRFAELLADPHKTARAGAARAVASLGHPEGVPLVKLKLLMGDTDAEVIGECASALLRLAPDEGLRLVVPLLESHDEDVRVEIAVALGESRNPRALAPLRECWERQYDRSVRKILLSSMAILRSDEADEFLLSLIRGRDDKTAADATEALAPFAKSGELRDGLEAAIQKGGNSQRQ